VRIISLVNMTSDTFRGCAHQAEGLKPVKKVFRQKHMHLSIILGLCLALLEMLCQGKPGVCCRYSGAHLNEGKQAEEGKGGRGSRA
jgi:hypothetical protein